MILRYSWNACDPKQLHPKHQGNHPPKQFRWETSGWVLQTDLVANLCCRSPGVSDSQGKSGVTQGSCPPRVMISLTFFSRGCLSYVPPENPYLVPPDNPCFTMLPYKNPQLIRCFMASFSPDLGLDSRIRISTYAKRHPGGQVLHPSMAKFYHLVEAIRSWTKHSKFPQLSIPLSYFQGILDIFRGWRFSPAWRIQLGEIPWV